MSIFRLSRFETLKRISKILIVSNTLKTQRRLTMKTYLLNLWSALADLFTFQEKNVVVAGGAPLPLDLQFFAGNPNPDGNEPPAEPEPEPTPQAEPEPTAKPDKTVPYARFDEVNERAKLAEAALQKIKDDEAERVRLAKEKQGEYETLYQEAEGKAKQFESDYETAKERADRLEGVMTNMLNAKLETVPEEYHDLIPENLSSEEKLEWVTKAEAKGLLKDKSKEPLGRGTNPAGSATDLDGLPVSQLFQSGYKN